MLFGKKRTIEELKKKLGKTEAELKASQDLLKDTNEKFNDARRHSTAVKTDLQDSIDEKDKIIADLKGRLVAAEDGLKKAVAEKETALKELTAAKAEIGSLESKVEAAAKEKTELLSKLSSIGSPAAGALEREDEGYDVTFIADGKEVAKVRMESEADSDKIPEVPFKEHHTGEWQYERNGKDVTVTAVYTPIVYDLVFFVDDARYAEMEATADQFSSLPPVPEREDYDGEWRYTFIDGHSARIDAVYTPKVYDLVFFVDDVKYAEAKATAEDFSSIPPVPEREDYEGEWRYTFIDGNSARIDAVYTPKVYDLVFFVDDAEYAEMEASAEDFPSIPPVPEREDYDGEWRYTFIDGNSARIDAVYAPVEYKIRYLADGEEIARTTASVESNIIIPEVPEKEGYKGEWQYSVCGDTVDVEAVYEPAYYDLVFFVDDVKYAEKRVDPDEDFDLPEVPEKEDYVGEWAYTVIDGNSARIDAVYTPVTYLLRFFADGEMIAERAASPGSDVDVPAVPAKEGYKGEWQYEDLGDHVAAVEAVYEPAYYDLVFFVDDVKYAEKRVDPDEDFDLPEVPAKKGFDGEWAYTVIDGNSARIDAVYNPAKKFKLTFYVDDEKYAECEVADENDLENIPEVPKREDCAGEWQYVQTGECSADMFAVYTPREYRLSFYVDGEKYAEAIVTSAEDKAVIPRVPRRKGFSGEWVYEDSDDENVIVTAVYTAK